MEAMGRAIHRGREAATVKHRRMTAALHALDDKNVFFEHDLPQLRVARAHGFIGVWGRVVEVDILGGFFGAFGHQNDCKGMIAVRAQKHVRIDRELFRRFVPFFADIIEIWEGFIVFIAQLTVDHRPLAREFAGFFDVVMIF